MNLNGSITYKYEKGTSVNLKNIRVIYAGEMLLQTETSVIKICANCYHNAEKQFFAVESIGSKESIPFWIYFDTKGVVNFRMNRDIIKSLELFSVYKFIQSLNQSDCSVKIKKGLGFDELFIFSINEKIKKDGDYDLLETFAIVESRFGEVLSEKGIILSLPEKYSLEDKKAICKLGLTLKDMEFQLGFQNEEDYKNINRPGFVFDFDQDWRRYVIFQGKKLTLVANGSGEFIRFDDQKQSAVFKMTKPKYIYLEVD